MNIALIVAAGRGYRVGGPIPKQYLPIGGESILRRTIQVFQSHSQIVAIQVLINPDDQALYDAATEGLGLRPPILGGATRQHSVRNGLEGIAALNPAKVLIHDAVRPFISHATISAVLKALDRGPAAIAGVPLADTLKRCENGIVTATIDRANLYRAQTPQGFRYSDILIAHRQALSTAPEIAFTDDAMIAEHAKMPVELVVDSEHNFKITTLEDLRRAESLLQPEK